MVVEIVAAFVALIALVLLGAYVVSIYNGLVSLRRRVEQSKRNIDVLLKQRQDELEKLIDTAREFMEHEETVLVALTEAREAAERARSPAEQADADQAIRTALADFRARVEDYPQLRSQSNMMQLQQRISDVESQIADRREFYNEAVTQYNTRIDQFPYLLFARAFGFTEARLFAATAEETADVDVRAAFA